MEHLTQSLHALFIEGRTDGAVRMLGAPPDRLLGTLLVELMDDVAHGVRIGA